MWNSRAFYKTILIVLVIAILVFVLAALFVEFFLVG